MKTNTHRNTAETSSLMGEPKSSIRIKFFFEDVKVKIPQLLLLNVVAVVVVEAFGLY